jgi:hypothetical protein
LVCAQLTESQAEQAGLRGAVVVTMRHLMSQQRAAREMMEHLADALAAGPPPREAAGAAAAEPQQAGANAAVVALQELASTVAGHLRELAAAPRLDATVSCLEGMLGPVPTAAEVRLFVLSMQAF